ncbi:hypothetical protein J6590_062580 [Homalodisca vitripennis]|nr:hypothetical protein J6590_062580 [Homalodisca vitripennis]
MCLGHERHCDSWPPVSPDPYRGCYRSNIYCRWPWRNISRRSSSRPLSYTRRSFNYRPSPVQLAPVPGSVTDHDSPSHPLQLGVVECTPNSHVSATNLLEIV